MIPFLLAVVLTEALVEVIVASAILASLREWALLRFPRAGMLFSCGYCLSLWVGVAVSCALGIEAGLGLGLAEPLLLGFAVHRLSNLWHEALRRFLCRLPWRIVVVRQELPPPPAGGGALIEKEVL